MKERLELTIDGEDFVALSREAYERLVEAAEDAADSAAIARFEQRLAAGEEEFVPSAMVDRILAGENLVRVWREHRGLTVSALAEMAGIAQPYLSQIETGKREGTLQTMKKIAGALRVKLDDLV
ncbi:helix-turn-helix domain-containing protein [Bosea sp. (in: a-proteobacteria)]|jgi:DNA-binding XRE family transcriptional regulator|uniref:helix-turn-helix domain-containing protein n=1 Tax=Bosea sp. (in: a-proteobacteria) TaxID=1871050 RepID=UPI000A77D76D|nr:helix-turn-helix transcriptional regulator [Bosea sp. (in: a-proteobacteria)]WRH56535.1 MAG: helix-turn-helix transcriptional regulator [Bosea sp. (in: a-proteobacteria)]